jgi:oxaloacetate decarboxylase alpha subunit/pyruvate carboxylase subunit B
VSIVPFANGTGQPDCARMLSLLQNHPRKPNYNERKLMELRAMFTDIYGKLGKFTSHDNEVVDNDALTYEVPGGMLSNFRNQLKELKMEDKFNEVFAGFPSFARRWAGFHWSPRLRRSWARRR